MTEEKMQLTKENLKLILPITWLAMEQNITTYSRCFDASCITKAVFERLGYTAELFPCSVVAMSRGVAQGDGSPRRTVEIHANKYTSPVDTPNSDAQEGNSLYGHVCVALNVDMGDGPRCTVVDMTAYQFKRNLLGHGWLLDAPPFIAIPTDLVNYSRCKKYNELPLKKAEHRQEKKPITISAPLPCRGGVFYQYERLHKLEDCSTGYSYKKEKWAELIAAIVHEIKIRQ